MEKRTDLRPTNLELMCGVSLILFGLCYLSRNSALAFTLAFGGLSFSHLFYAVWCWLGRSDRARIWASRGFLGEMLVLGIYPGTGMMFASITLASAFDNLGNFSVLLAIPFFSGLFALAIGTFVLPKWWGPRWYRERAGENVQEH